MKSLDTIAQKVVGAMSNKQEGQRKSAVVPEQAALVINQLFLDLKAIFPAWKNAFPSNLIEQQAKKEWTKAFIENGIGRTEQLRLGLKKARNYGEPWFPSCGQFIAWCKPNIEDYGLPPADQALRMVIDGKKKQLPALYVAARATGTWNLKNLPHKSLFPMFERNYEIVCERVMNGEDLTGEIPLALPKKVFVPVSATSEFKAARDKLKQYVEATS